MYGYTFSNPVNNIDINGLTTIVLSAEVGAVVGVTGDVQIDLNTGDVYLSGGVGVGVGASATASLTEQVPEEGAAWSFSASIAAGLGAELTTEWDASTYSSSGEHSFSYDIYPVAGIGGGVTGTFGGTTKAGNLYDVVDAWGNMIKSCF